MTDDHAQPERAALIAGLSRDSVAASLEWKRAKAKEWLDRKWLLHPANRVTKERHLSHVGGKP